ncbi:fumarylacetoacetate hydrolase family protein [Paraburkholderia graminis]
MKLVSFSVEGGTVEGGLWFESGVLPFDAAAPIIDAPELGSSAATVLNVLRSGRSLTDRLMELDRSVRSGSHSDRLVAHDMVKLAAPIPRPEKNVFCVGRNYLDHVKEGYKARGTDLKVPEFIQLFSKPPTTVVGTGADIRYDKRLTQKLDYEAELGLVIGKAGRDIRPEDAFDHIFGYTVINDVTARDLQRAHDQWFKGKGLDTSCPMGPWIVTADEVVEPQNLHIRCMVNGEVRQESNTSMMIFDIRTIIAELSRGLTLEPGDIIATGTPSGVGYAMEPPRLLNVGDVVEVSVAGVGSIRNTVAAA